MKRKKKFCLKNWSTSQVYSSQVSENKLSHTNVKRAGLISILCNQLVYLNVSTVIRVYWHQKLKYIVNFYNVTKARKIKIIPSIRVCNYNVYKQMICTILCIWKLLPGTLCLMKYMLCNNLMRGFWVHRFSFSEYQNIKWLFSCQQ